MYTRQTNSYHVRAPVSRRIASAVAGGDTTPVKGHGHVVGTDPVLLADDAGGKVKACNRERRHRDH